MLSYLDDENLKLLVLDGNKLLISKNIVYDVTKYYNKHPGGNCILKKCITIINNRLDYKDCEIDFNFHSKNGKKIWTNLAIGRIDRPGILTKLFYLFLKKL